MKREILIALLFIVTTILAIWGFKFISGKNLFSGDNNYAIIVNNAKDINSATPVLINGYQVGTVTNISPLPEDIRQIRIDFQVNKDIKLPQYTSVEVRAQNPLGGKELELVFDKYCNGSNCAESGAIFKQEAIGLVGSLITQEELNPHIESITAGIQSTLGSLGKEDSDAALDKTIRNMSVTMENLASSTTRLNSLMVNSSKNMETTLANMAILTGSLVNSNAQLGAILNNLTTVTEDFAKVSLSETMVKTDATIVQAGASLKTLETTMGEATLMIQDLNKTMTMATTGEGSMAKLINDKELYNNLESTTQNLNLLLQDVRLNPRRYFKVFGKKVPAYEFPEVDPADGSND